MRHITHIALLLALCFPVFGQKLYPIQETEDSIAFQLSTQNGKLVLLAPTEGELFKSKKDFPTILALRLEGSDLVLEYQPKKTSDVQSYKIEMRMQMPDGHLFSPFDYETSDRELSAGIRRLAWLDAAEYLPDFNASYVLHIHRSLMSAVNCEAPRPAFTLKKQLPHYAAGGVGLVLLGLGQVYRDQRDGYYADYQQRWSDGLPGSDAAKDQLQKAKNKDHDARIYSWTGLAVLGIDALLFARRSVKINRQRRIYDKFCGSSTSLNFQPVLLPGAGLGFGISCSW